MPTSLEFAARTDVGLHRRENQDRHLECPDLGLYAIADGMGGLPHGIEAAETALRTFERTYRAAPPANAADWRQLVFTVNREVAALGRRLSPMMGIGTTLSALRFAPGRVELVHVGDSAAFRLRDRRWTQLTPEHTVGARVRRLRAAGLAPDAAEEGADHVLTSCIGLVPLEEIELATLEVRKGDRYLICSDGITKPVPAEEVAETMAAAASPAAAAEALIALAHRWGAPDNATAVVVFCRE